MSTYLFHPPSKGSDILKCTVYILNERILPKQQQICRRENANKNDETSLQICKFNWHENI